MRIAVTGGSGRIGSAVVNEALKHGHTVISIDRVQPAESRSPRQVMSVQADLTDYASFEDALHGAEALIHLAAIPSPLRNPDHEVHNNNVVASYNALSAANRLGIRRVCQASSINAIGASYSRWPRYDYFPLDEQHPTYNEDAYSLSKWICERQADSFVRRYEQMVVASLRFHWVVPDRQTAEAREQVADEEARRALARGLWAYTLLEAAARACVLSVSADFSGHQVFYIVAPRTMMSVPSEELKARYFPDTPVRGTLDGCQAFYSSARAERLLGWRHDDDHVAEPQTGTGAAV